MRILCRHGHFSFYPRDAEDISRFCDLFDEELVRVDDFYTFSYLEDVPNYSLLGKTFLGLPATATFEGQPWDVMKENGYVYSLALKLVVPKVSIVNVIRLELVDNFWTLDNPIIQPASLNPVGQRIMSYDAQYFRETSQLRVSEVLLV